MPLGIVQILLQNYVSPLHLAREASRRNSDAADLAAPRKERRDPFPRDEGQTRNEMSNPRTRESGASRTRAPARPRIPKIPDYECAEGSQTSATLIFPSAQVGAVRDSHGDRRIRGLVKKYIKCCKRGN